MNNYKDVAEKVYRAHKSVAYTIIQVQDEGASEKQAKDTADEVADEVNRYNKEALQFAMTHYSFKKSLAFVRSMLVEHYPKLTDQEVDQINLQAINKYEDIQHQKINS